MLAMVYFLDCVFAVFLMTVSVSGVLGRTISDIGSECGQVKSSYVCDPDRVLTVDEGIQYCVIALYPLRSLATSVLIHFGPFYKDRTDKGPKWQRTEVDVQIGTKDRSG